MNAPVWLNPPPLFVFPLMHRAAALLHLSMRTRGGWDVQAATYLTLYVSDVCTHFLVIKHVSCTIRPAWKKTGFTHSSWERP